jgi:hypothetical protein
MIAPTQLPASPPKVTLRAKMYATLQTWDSNDLSVSRYLRSSEDSHPRSCMTHEISKPWDTWYAVQRNTSVRCFVSHLSHRMPVELH